MNDWFYRNNLVTYLSAILFLQKAQGKTNKESSFDWMDFSSNQFIGRSLIQFL